MSDSIVILLMEMSVLLLKNDYAIEAQTLELDGYPIRSKSSLAHDEPFTSATLSSSACVCVGYVIGACTGSNSSCKKKVTLTDDDNTY